MIYLLVGNAPVTLLVVAGDELILPIGFTVVLWVAWRRRDLLYLDYQSLGGSASR